MKHGALGENSRRAVSLIGLLHFFVRRTIMTLNQ